MPSPRPRVPSPTLGHYPRHGVPNAFNHRQSPPYCRALLTRWQHANLHGRDSSFSRRDAVGRCWSSVVAARRRVHYCVRTDHRRVAATMMMAGNCSGNSWHASTVTLGLGTQKLPPKVVPRRGCSCGRRERRGATSQGGALGGCGRRWAGRGRAPEWCFVGDTEAEVTADGALQSPAKSSGRKGRGNVEVKTGR